jgi:hypothetical protein
LKAEEEEIKRAEDGKTWLGKAGDWIGKTLGVSSP